jgi:hypothetical protein
VRGKNKIPIEKQKNMETRMKARSFYRDGLTENIVGPIKITTTSDGHVVERYTLTDGKKRFFATIAGSHWSAHGDTIANAVADALWKDPDRRPSMEALAEEIKKSGKKREINLNEFRLLTGACLEGCRTAIKKSGVTETALTAYAIRDKISKEWGSKLLLVLQWEAYD